MRPSEEQRRRDNARKMTCDDLERIAQGYHAMAWQEHLRGDFVLAYELRELRDWYEAEAEKEREENEAYRRH